MEMVASVIPLAAVFSGLVGACLVVLTGRWPNVRETVSFVTAVVMFALVASMIPDVAPAPVGRGLPLHQTLFPILPGLSVSFRADAFSMVFALVASFLWIITVFYSAGYMRGLKEHAQTRFSVCFALTLFGAMGVAFADNLFTLYLFYEVVSICTYPLVAHHQDEEGYEGARKYIVYLTTTAKGLVLPAMIVIYVLTGNLDFAHNSHEGIFHGGVSNALATVLYVCCLLGFAKNGIMPLHHWVMLYVFGTDLMKSLNLGVPTAYFVSFTILTASVIALTKDNLKARLAYSTVSQLSYIILGVALLTVDGIQGGIVHIANHAFSKITLFFCAGAIYVATHKKCISEMSGLGRTMPFTFAAFAVASLSMIGAPPVAGFVTKWKLLTGAMEMPAHAVGIMLVLLASTLLNVAYFAPVTYKAFFGKRPAGEATQGIREAPLAMVVPILLAAIVSVLLGVYPDAIMSFVKAVTG